MRGIIISNGHMEDEIFYKSHISERDFVICCDGGANIAYMYGIVPNMIIGDFDSIDQKVLNFYKSKNIPIMQYPAEKDKTDTHIAVEYFIKNRFEEVIMLSCTGFRLDHVLANISLLYELTKNKINCKIIDKKNIIMMTDSQIKIEGKKGCTLSLIPYTQYVNGITTKGLYYPVCDGYMEFGNPYGVSNVIIEDVAIIQVKEGYLLVILSSD